ncbi:MAG: FKBP-type peptidyl-prolyl cis-trans isomerase [Lachnospiraceae bacterium]
MEEKNELYDQLKAAIKAMKRTEVEKLLKKGALECVPGGEKTDICRRLVALRDEKIMAVLAKKLDRFTPNLFQLDLTNWNNRNFVSEILGKYRKKFDLNDGSVCEQLFEIACQVDHKPTVSYLVKEKKAKRFYWLLAESAEDLFDVLLTIPADTFDADERVEILYRAAMAENGQERLEELQKKNYSFEEKTSDGKTLETFVREAAKAVKRSQAHGNEILRYLQKKRENPNAEIAVKKINGQEQTTSKKWVPVIATVVVVAILAIVGIAVEVSQKNTKTTTASQDNSTESAVSEDVASEASDSQGIDTAEDTEAESDAYVTDPDRKVEDGDTVNIDYTGYVDDVAFDGGSTNGTGTDLTIGSHSYIDDFEEQLIGHKAGENVTVNVTFPENYGKEELNGKEARFEVTINGIYADE